MFLLGDLELPSNVFCAPLAGCSDLPFRRMLKQHGAGLVYCEMVKMDAIVRHDANSYRLLDYEAGMHPIGAQLCGSKPQLAAKSAKIVEDLGFDVLDLNCGCPVDKVTKDGSGSGLLRNPELIGEILSNMIAAVKIPVTVKIRAGWDSESINAVAITKIAEKAGAKAICIHGRTRAQGYKGPANWDHIRMCKETAKEIKVIGNGDLFDAESVKRMFAYTKCDAVLIARGTMGQPWIIEDIRRMFAGLPPIARTGLDYREAILQHLLHTMSYQPERRAMLDMRRVGCWYLKKAEGTRKLREVISRGKSLKDIHEMILQFPWHEIDFSKAPVEEECEESCGT